MKPVQYAPEGSWADPAPMFAHLKDLASLLGFRYTATAIPALAKRGSERPKPETAAKLVDDLSEELARDFVELEAAGRGYWAEWNKIEAAAAHFSFAMQPLEYEAIGKTRKRTLDLLEWLRSNASASKPAANAALATEMFEYLTFFEVRVKPVIGELEKYAKAVLAQNPEKWESCRFAIQALVEDVDTKIVATNDEGDTGPRADTFLLRNSLAHATWSGGSEASVLVDLADYKGAMVLEPRVVSRGDLPRLIQRLQRRLLLFELFLALNVIVLSLRPINQKSLIKALHDAIEGGALKRPGKSR